MASRQNSDPKHDSVVKAAVITAAATILAAVIAAAGAFAAGWLQFRAPGSPTEQAATEGPGSDPATPDTPLEEGVQTTVAPRPEVSYLTELQPVEGEPETGQRAVNARTYEHSVALTGCENAQVGYNLDRRRQRFRAVIGPTDTTKSELVMRFRVLLDGRQLAQHDLKVGQTKGLDLDVTGGLRLLLQAEFGEYYGGSFESYFDHCTDAGEAAVWGDARVS